MYRLVLVCNTRWANHPLVFGSPPWSLNINSLHLPTLLTNLVLCEKKMRVNIVDVTLRTTTAERLIGHSWRLSHSQVRKGGTVDKCAAVKSSPRAALQQKNTDKQSPATAEKYQQAKSTNKYQVLKYAVGKCSRKAEPSCSQKVPKSEKGGW